MLEKFKKYWLENAEVICAGVIMMHGGYYRPYAK